MCDFNEDYPQPQKDEPEGFVYLLAFALIVAVILLSVI